MDLWDWSELTGHIVLQSALYTSSKLFHEEMPETPLFEKWITCKISGLAFSLAQLLKVCGRARGKLGNRKSKT